MSRLPHCHDDDDDDDDLLKREKLQLLPSGCQPETPGQTGVAASGGEAPHHHRTVQ